MCGRLYDLADYAEEHPLTGYPLMAGYLLYAVCDVIVDVLSGVFWESEWKL